MFPKLIPGSYFYVSCDENSPNYIAIRSVSAARSLSKPHYHLLPQLDTLGTCMSKLTTYYRIITNDKWSITGTSDSLSCPACTEQWTSWLYHIIYDCRAITFTDERKALQHSLTPAQIQSNQFPCYVMPQHHTAIINTVHLWQSSLNIHH